MTRRRPHRLNRPVAGHTAKALPANLASAGGQVRTADQIMSLLQQGQRGQLAQPLPRDQYPYEFGPGVPLQPAPLDPTNPRTGRAEPRLWDYPVSWNLPGVTAGRIVPWRILRDAAQLPLIRDCIRIRKAEVAGLEWDFTLSRRAVSRAQQDNPDSSRLDVEQKLRSQLAPEIDRAVSFWEVPDRGNGYTFTEWISQFLEEHLVLDALAIYPRRTLGGDLYALEVLDGATIKPLLDHRGGRPQPPEPAYQQILYGFPRGEFVADTSDTGGQAVIADGYAADQLIYIRREVRTHTPYGLSPVEQALLDIDLWQKRIGWLRAEYTDGVMPAGWLINNQTGTGAWTPSQVAEYERALNDHYAGNTEQRMRYRALPPGWEPADAAHDQAEKYKPEFDMHLLKLVVAHFDLTVHELGFTEAKGLGSDGHAEGQDRLNDRKGRDPILKWIAALITDMSRAHLDLPRELEFRWLGLDDEEEDSERVRADVAAGLLTLNEGRDEIGRPRYRFPDADRPALMTGGVTYIEDAAERDAAAAAAAADAAGGFGGQAGLDSSKPKDDAEGGDGQGEDDQRPKCVALTAAGNHCDNRAAGGGSLCRQHAASAKTVEAAAYRRWARRAPTSARRFVLKHLLVDDLAEHGVDPARVDLPKAAGGGRGKAPGPPGPGRSTPR